jgi:hypothetical protein
MKRRKFGPIHIPGLPELVHVETSWVLVRQWLGTTLSLGAAHPRTLSVWWCTPHDYFSQKIPKIQKVQKVQKIQKI